MGILTVPKQISYDWLNQFVLRLGLGDTSEPSVNQARMFYENGKFILRAFDGTGFKRINEYTAADVLDLIKTVDGSGSGLDADKLDENDGDYYAVKRWDPADGNTPLSNYPDGITMNYVTNNDPGWPLTAGIAMTVKCGNYRCCQLFFDHYGYFRYIRGYRDDDGFYDWKKVWSEYNHGSNSGLDADLYRGKKVQWGTVTNAKDSGIAVFFPEAFSSTPKVFASVREELTCWITDITTSFCKIKVNAATNKVADWLALG